MQRGRQQNLRVGVLRVQQNVISGADFNNTTGIHHRNTVANFSGHTEVMCDKNRAHAQALLQLLRQLLHAGQDVGHHAGVIPQMREQGIGILPQSLGEAIDKLENNKVIRDALGNALSEEFITLKRAESLEYQRHVSDWEINRYVEFF